MNTPEVPSLSERFTENQWLQPRDWSGQLSRWVVGGTQRNLCAPFSADRIQKHYIAAHILLHSIPRFPLGTVAVLIILGNLFICRRTKNNGLGVPQYTKQSRRYHTFSTLKVLLLTVAVFKMLFVLKRCTCQMEELDSDPWTRK